MSTDLLITDVLIMFHCCDNYYRSRIGHVLNHVSYNIENNSRFSTLEGVYSIVMSLSICLSE